MAEELLTILENATDGSPCAKIVYRCEESATGYKSESSNPPLLCSVHRELISDIYSLSDLLLSLSQEPRKFLVRGEPRPEVDCSAPIQRLSRSKNGRPATFRSKPEGSHLLLIDIDGWPEPDRISLANDPEAAVKYVIGLLPRYLQDVTVHWHLSGSAGVKPGIRLHLSYYLKSRKTDEEVQRWAAQANNDLKGLIGKDMPIDPSVYGPIQPNYTSDPVFAFDLSEDIVAQRSGLLVGSVDDVELPVPPQPPRGRSPGKRSATGYVSRSFKEALLKITDETRHDAALHAMYFAVREALARGDEKESVKDDIINSISERILETASDGEGHRHASYEYLENDFYSAWDKASSLSLKPGIPPHFKADYVSVEEARKRVRDAYEKAFNQACDPGLPIVIKGSAGLGKTTAFVELIKEKAKQREELVIFACFPTHKLCEEFHALCGNIPNAEVRHIKGRNRPGMCIQPDKAEKYAKAGFSVTESLCKEDRCEGFVGCKYLAQHIIPKEKSIKVVILTHEYLFLKFNKNLPKPDITFIDESFFQKACVEVKWPIGRNRLLNAIAYGHSFYRQRITDALEGPDFLGELKRILECRETAGMARELEWLSIQEDYSPEDINRSKDAIKPDDIAFLDIIQEEFQLRDGQELTCLFYRGNNEFTGHFRRSMQSAFLRSQVVISDADADSEILDPLIREHDFVMALVRRNVHVVQVHSNTFSNLHISKNGSDVEKVADFAATKTDPVLFTTKKGRELISRANGCDEGGLLDSFKGMPIGHFNALRGLDIYKHRETVVILGRVEPQIEVVEALARAMFYDSPKAIEVGFKKYTRDPRGYRMRCGTKRGLNVRVHPTGRVQKLLEQVRECESLQAIDRIRSIHCPAPKKVYIVCNIPLDIDVDELVDKTDILGMKTASNVMADAGVLLWSPGHLAKFLPEFFPSKASAESWRKREFKKKGVGFYSNIYMETDPLFTKVEYRLEGQRGSMAIAYISNQHADPREALEDFIGEKVKEFNAPEF